MKRTTEKRQYTPRKATWRPQSLRQRKRAAAEVGKRLWRGGSGHGRTEIMSSPCACIMVGLPFSTASSSYSAREHSVFPPRKARFDPMCAQTLDERTGRILPTHCGPPTSEKHRPPFHALPPLGIFFCAPTPNGNSGLFIVCSIACRRVRSPRQPEGGIAARVHICMSRWAIRVDTGRGRSASNVRAAVAESTAISHRCAHACMSARKRNTVLRFRGRNLTRRARSFPLRFVLDACHDRNPREANGDG